MGNISGLAGLEVLIGLSFVFFLLSTACSAVQETLATIFGWRAKTLEDAVGNMLGDPQLKRGWKEWFGRVGKRVPMDDAAEHAHIQAAMSADLTTEVFTHWRIRSLVRVPGSSLRRHGRPSYVPARALSLAVAETLAQHAPAPPTPGEKAPTARPWEQTDDAIFAGLNQALRRLPAEYPREVLQKAAMNATDLERFREHIETAFNDSMERASGWYKRKAQLVLVILAVAFAVGLNVDAVRIANHLYEDQAVRTAVVGQVGQVGRPLQPQVGQVGKPTQPQVAADAVSRVTQLHLPVGWGAADAPSSVGDWFSRIPGWLITIAALNLGAPFWFDLLSRLSRQRESGTPDAPKRQLSDMPPEGKPPGDQPASANPAAPRPVAG